MHCHSKKSRSQFFSSYCSSLWSTDPLFRETKWNGRQNVRSARAWALVHVCTALKRCSGYLQCIWHDKLLENWFYRGMTILFGVLKGAWPVVSMVRLRYNGQKHSLMTDRCLIVQCWHHMLLTRDYPQHGYVAVKTVWSKFHSSHNTRRLDTPKWQIGHIIFDSLWISDCMFFKQLSVGVPHAHQIVRLIKE